MNTHMNAVFFGVVDHDAFCSSIQSAIHQVKSGGIYAGDNLFTFNRNLGFMDDEKLMNSFRENAETEIEQAVLWRYNVLCWAAERSVALEGDLVECACYKGTSARIVADYVSLNDIDKKFYLYDLFEHDDGMRHHHMPEHSSDLFGWVKERFNDFPGVIVTKGEVPFILNEVAPEKISFLHLDLNDAEAELGALEFFWDRLTPGASIVFDDYGWVDYKSQQAAELPWLLERGYRPLELPTGQGLLIK